MHRKNAVVAAMAVVPLAAAVVGGVSIAMEGGGGGSAAQLSAIGVSVRTVNCPSVAGKLPAVPKAARAEVRRDLALLQTQIGEANHRLATTVGQGGPNFAQNAILGPLRDKRFATLDRIAIAIGRTGAPKPTNLQRLATCTLQ